MSYPTTKAVTYREINDHSYNKEVERINDLLSRHFSQTDRSVTVMIPNLHRTALIDAFSEGWEISFSYSEYDDECSYHEFRPKY